MLVVDLGELSYGPVRLDTCVPADDLGLEGLSGTPTGPVEVKGEVAKTGAGQYYLRGSVRIPLDAECRRCLIPVHVTVNTPVDALFTEDAERLGDPNVYPVAADANTLDVSPAVRDELLLTNPSYPLCREDCRGLCPNCGANRNTAACDCQPEHDPRWDALRSLRESSGTDR